MRLHLKGLENFSATCGDKTLLVSVLSHSGNKRLIRLKTAGEPRKEKEITKESPYWTEVVIVDADPAPGKGEIPVRDGHIEVRLPAELLKDKVLKLGWIDFYRG